jgi:hypothetical protein
MDRFFITECNNSKNLAVKLLNFSPKAITVISLLFNPYRIFKDLDAPLFIYIRPLSQNLIQKIVGVLIIH